MAKKDNFLSVSEAAEVLGVVRQRVLKLISDERIEAQKIGNQWVINESALDAVKERPTGRPPKDNKK